MTGMGANKTSRSTVVEFQKDANGRFHPFSLTVIEDHGDYLSRTIYDIERSRKYGYTFDQTGSGGSEPVTVRGPYFTAGDVAVKEEPCCLVDRNDRAPWRSKKTKAIRVRNRTRLLRSLPKAFAVKAGDDMLDWLHAHALECDAVWCATCRDWLLESSLCDHIWWCDASAWWSTPSERCACKDRDVCHG